MCGITGLYSVMARPARQELHRIAQNMTQALLTRGPDSGDVWQDPDAPLVLGHRRLSILDLSPAGHQPMESQSGRYMIAYNGEIYNFKSLRSDLEYHHGKRFRGNSDTEVLLSLFDVHGVSKTLSLINGMFVIALWDRKTKALYLMRDRMGKKPLYVGWSGSTLVFGSELKALCAHPDFRRDVNRVALTSYMRFGYVPAPYAIYDQVWQLPPASMMALDMQILRGGQDLKSMMEYYWHPAQEIKKAQQQKHPQGHNAIEDFESLLSQCVSDRMVSDVPLGSFLSGGIDSSLITALMQKQSSKPVKTYTIGFQEDAYNEAQSAKDIAQHLGTEHHEHYLSAADSLKVVEQLPVIYDEPFADASAIPTYLVSKFARESVIVALSGDGGDEMLGGYNRHIAGPKCWKTMQNIPAPLRGPLADMIRSISPAQWDALRKKRPQFGAHMHKFADILGKSFEGDVYMSFVTHWQSPKTIVIDGAEDLIPLVDPAMQVEGLSFAQSMMYWDMLSYMSGDVLTKVDRASMAVSLEARAPFLDRRIFDYVWRLDEDLKIRDGKGKYLAREVLARHIPRALFERPKQGFSVPVGDWLRGELKDWAEDLLDPAILRDQGFFNYPEITRIWEEHKKGRGSHAQKLWTVLMFQSWYRHWIVNA